MQPFTQAIIVAVRPLPPQAARAWTTASMLLWFCVGTVVLIVVTMLLLRARSRAARAGGRSRPGTSPAVDPWVEAGRRVDNPPATRTDDGSVSGADDDPARGGGAP